MLLLDNNLRISVIAPHSDDAEFGCAGFIAKVTSAGGHASFFVTAYGDVAFLHSGNVPGRVRKDETIAAARVLGISDVQFGFEGKDGLLDTLPFKTIVTAMEKFIEQTRPQILLIPLPSHHQDHTACYEAAIAASRLSHYKHTPQLIAAYEYPYQSWGAGSSAKSFEGGMYVDISATIETKIAALRCHRSQMRTNRDLVSIEASRAMAILRGYECGRNYAELFYIKRLLL